MFGVGHDQHGFESAQDAVGTPVAGQFDRGAHQVALVLFELGLEAFLQRERVGRGAGETGQDLVVIEAADLAGRALDDDVAQGDLAIAAERDTVAAADTHDGGGVKLFHAFLPLKGLAGGEANEIKACGPMKKGRPATPRRAAPGAGAGTGRFHHQAARQ